MGVGGEGKAPRPRVPGSWALTNAAHAPLPPHTLFARAIFPQFPFHSYTPPPRPQVLADFHTCRSNYQAAAGAMLAYARRLVAECLEEPAQLAEAERALATAVSCLR